MENSVQSDGYRCAHPSRLAIGLKRRVMRPIGIVPSGKACDPILVFSRQACQSVTAQAEVASAWAANAVLSVSDVPRRNGVFAYDASTSARFAARE